MPSNRLAGQHREKICWPTDELCSYPTICPKKSKDFSQRRYKNCPSVMGDTWRRDAEVVKSGRGSSLAARNNCFGTSYHGWEDFSRGSSIFSKILCLLCSFCLNSDEYHMTDPNDSITCVRYTVPSF